MSETIEKLAVELALEAGSFSKQISSINKEIKNLERDFKSAGNGTKNFENSFVGLDAKIQKTARQIDLYNKKLISQKQEQDKLKSTLTEQKSKLDSLEATLGKGSKEWQKQAQLVQQTSSKLNRLNSDVKQTESTINKLGTELNQSTRAFSNLGNKTQTIEQKLANVNRQTTLTESEFNKLGAELNQSGTYFQRLGNEMQQLSAKIQSNKAMLSIYESEIRKLNTSLTQNKQTHSQLKTEINQTRNALEQAKSKFGANSTEAQQLHAKLLQLKDAYNKSEHEIEQSNAALDRYQAEINNTRADITRLSAQLRQMPFNTMGQSMVSAGQKIKGVGQSLGMYVTMPLTMLGVAASRAGVNFDTSMSKLQATAGIADKSSVSFQKLQEKAQDLGARTSFSASEAADGLTYLALAGWDVETSLSRIEPVLRAAEAGGMDLALCSDLVTDSMSSAGIASKDFTKYLDITAQAQRKSNSSMQQMLEAYVVAGGMFKNLNMPLEKSGALLGVLANRGTKGSEAGNAIISVFSNLITEAGQAGKALEKLKISLFDKKTGKQRDTIEVLKEMAQKLGVTADGTSKLTEAEQAQYAAMVGGKTQYDSLMKMLAGVSDEYDDLENNLRNSKGSLMEVAKTMKDNLGGAITNMKSALEGAGIQAFKAMEPVLASLIEKITQLSNWFTNLSESSQQSIVKMAAMAAALAPILIAFGQLIIVGGNLTLIIGHIKAAMTATAGTSTSLLTKLGNLTTKLFSLQGAFALLAVAGIGVAVKALHDYSVQDGKLYEQRKKNIESLEREKKGYQEAKEKIGYIAKEYDTLKSKSKLSNEEAERLKELTKQIADLMPELVSGYDENGNPILSMKGSAEELCLELDRAIEKKERLIGFDKQDNAKIAMEKQAGKRDKDGNKVVGKAADSLQTDIEKVKTVQQKYNADMAKLEQEGAVLRGKIRNTEGKDREKYLLKYKNHLREKEKVTQDAQKNNERDIEAAKKVAQEVEEGIFASTTMGSVFKSSKNNDAKKQFNELKGLLDFSGIKTDEQFAKAEISMSKLFKSASDGKINLEGVKKQIEDANTALSKDGDLSSYNTKMQELAKTIATATGTKSSDWISLLTSLDKEFLRTTDSTDIFLKKFNRTRQELESGDSLAVAAQRQFDELNSAIEGLQITENKDVNVQTVIDFTNNQNIPEDIRKFTSSLIKKDANGNITNSEEVIKFTADLLFELQQEKPDWNILQQEADKLFGKGKVKVTEDLEITAGEIDSSKIDKNNIEQQVKDKFSKDKVTIKINTAIEKGEIDTSKIGLVDEIFNNINATKEVKTKFILENTDAINQAKNYEEFLKNFKDKEYLAKLGIKVEGKEETKQANKEFEKNNGKTSTQNVKLEGAEQAKKDTQELNKETDKVDGKVVETKVNNEQVEESVKDINQLVEMSKKVEDGKYKIDVQANTTDAVRNLELLKNKMNEVIKSFAGNKKVVFSAETELASKNVTGLKKNISDYDKKNTNKTKKTTFKTETALASKNVTGLKSNVSDYVSKYGNKTFTTTFKVVTNKVTTTSTSGTNNSGGTDEQSEDGRKSIPINLKRVETPTRKVPIRSSVPLLRKTAETPINMGNMGDSLKYNVNLFQELENRISAVNNELTLLDKKAEKATGKEKIKHLQKQNELYEEQQRLQLELQDKMLFKQTVTKSKLEGYGLQFNNEGNLKNAEEELLRREKKAAELEKKAKELSDRASNEKNEKRKEALEKQAEAAQKAYDKEKTSLDDVNKYIDEYIKTTLTDIPKCIEEWEELNKKKKENIDITEELNRQQKLFSKNSHIKELDMYKDLYSDEIDIIEEKINNASGSEKTDLIEEKIRLIEKQKKVQQDLINTYKSAIKVYQTDLSKFGFQFDDKGTIKNLDDILNKYQDSEDLEKITKLVDEYLTIQRDKLPDAVKDWEKLSTSIKNAYKEQLNIAKDIENQITDIYKKQLEERKKLIDEELKKRTDALNKEKEAYNDARKEADYQNQEDEQLQKIKDIEKNLELAKRDTTLSGQKKVQELIKQLKEEQKNLEKMVQDRIDEQVNDMFDKENDRLENEAEGAVKDLEEKFSDSKIKELIKEALKSGLFEDIDGQVKNLQDVMLKFLDDYGDGLGITGELIKDELVKNLEVATDVAKQYAEIMENLNLGKGGRSINYPNVDYSSERYNPQQRSINNQNTQEINIEFNQPLVVIQGDVSRNTIADLQKLSKDIKNSVVDEIIRKMKR